MVSPDPGGGGGGEGERKKEGRREEEGKVSSFPGPAQLSVTCSTEKQGEPGIFSRVSMTELENGENFQNKQAAFRVFY